jgi:hypothetical protein
MKHNIIKTNEYLLVCDDSEIKVGDYIYDLDLQKIVIANDLKTITSKSTNCWYYKKIIAHHPLNGAPILDDIAVLPSLPQEDGIHHREKYKYTEEDLVRAWTAGRAFFNMDFSFENWLSNYKESPQQLKYPIAFEFKMIKWVDELYCMVVEEPKTITNSEGRIEWVGKYIWE